jgi:hypothetical protein
MFRCDSVAHDYDVGKRDHFSIGYRLIEKYEKTINDLPYPNDVKLEIKERLKYSEKSYTNDLLEADILL